MRIRTAFVLGCLVMVMGGCKTARMKTVEPIRLSTGSPNATRDVVRKALVARRWAVVDETPDTIHAMLSSGAWSLAIVAEYDADSVTLRYAESNNLKYRKNKKGREYIHKNYNVWMKRLAEDIRLTGRAVTDKS